MEENKKFKRNCPSCSIEIFYLRKDGKERANRNNSLCYSCSKKGIKNSFYGKHHNEISKKIIGKYHKGQTSWNEGMIMSKEFRDKLSEHFKEKFKKQKHPWIGRHHTDETKKKLSISNKNIFLNKHHTEESKRKISESNRQSWKNGKRNSLPHWKSKGHIEISNIIRNFGYNVKDEYFIDGRPYDIFIKDKNLLIEFNGTYWHCDPRKFDENYYHSSHKRTAIQQWKYDEEKINLAKNNGYNIKTIWEIDWKNCNNKEEFLRKIIS